MNRRSIRVRGTAQKPAAEDEKCAEGKKAEVPGGLVACLAYMVDAEDVVIDDPFDEVEEAPADEHPADERAPADRPAPVRGAPPENPDAYSDSNPGGSVKEAVKECVGLEPCDGGGRVVALVGEHVVPLKDLVKDDAVHESAQADAQKDSGGARSGHGLHGRFVRKGAAGIVAASMRPAFPQWTVENSDLLVSSLPGSLGA